MQFVEQMNGLRLDLIIRKFIGCFFIHFSTYVVLAGNEVSSQFGDILILVSNEAVFCLKAWFGFVAIKLIEKRLIEWIFHAERCRLHIHLHVVAYEIGINLPIRTLIAKRMLTISYQHLEQVTAVLIKAVKWRMQPTIA